MQGPYDIDMHCMSYDVGHAKPDRRIFNAAAGLARTLVPSTEKGNAWVKVYVGDEFGADVVGGLRAGWNAVLVGDGVDVDRGLLPEEAEGPWALDPNDEDMAPERAFRWGGGEDERLVFLKADSVGTVLRWLAGMAKH